ncbi:hypothetical protein BACCIP111899_02469 [Bacillus rhizoplanae]|uniref:Uncharacterized protein n=1 Tax=Bacillus rhizoplanae TaxID=2880966 RepID=A0ABN8A129_9BACI|nr:hypothetical protein [Bacillus rhizoplanae]CAG9613255.1 hypothetical protein BACCIP111899_02469 [Bacillus rhizoplanae]
MGQFQSNSQTAEQIVPEDALFDIVRNIREKSKEIPEVICNRED